MTVHTASSIVTVPRHYVFDLVADVERYPEFVPLWRDARILRREGDRYYTEQEVGLGQMTQTFSTCTRLVRPQFIEVTSEDALFREFFIHWHFDILGTGSRVTVAISWEMTSSTMQAGIDRLLPRAARSTLTAFEQRALTLHGPDA